MKSDIWSLGCIAHELCEFKSPFREEGEKMSLMDLFNKITKGFLFIEKICEFKRRIPTNYKR